MRGVCGGEFLIVDGDAVLGDVEAVDGASGGERGEEGLRDVAGAATVVEDFEGAGGGLGEEEGGGAGEGEGFV